MFGLVRLNKYERIRRLVFRVDAIEDRVIHLERALDRLDLAWEREEVNDDEDTGNGSASPPA